MKRPSVMYGLLLAGVAIAAPIHAHASPFDTEIFYVVIFGGVRSKIGLFAALARISRDPHRSLDDLKAQFIGEQMHTFDAITESVIQKPLASPCQLDMNLVHARAARRAEHLLLGGKVSPLLGRQTGIAGLSAGRVQSVACAWS